MAAMDASYLKKNVLDALTEGLAAMAIKPSDDQVEFLGNYLLAVVQRKKAATNSSNESSVIEEKLVGVNEAEAREKEIADDIQKQIVAYEAKHAKALESISSSLLKSEAIDLAVSHIENNLNDIPSSYYAVKRVVNEVETLHYLQAGPRSQAVRGKKLVKVAVDEGEEGGPQRQGVSFEAFKLPEVPEEEPVEEEEGVERPKREPPKAQPLVIENVMRDKRVKFFGIPKLGAFVAVPFSYQSIDHDAGAVLNSSGEEGAVATWGLAPKETSFIIGIDSVGKYRLFKGEDIAKVQQVGEALIAAFTSIEANMGASQLKYFEDSRFKSQGDVCNAVRAAAGEEEAKAAAEPAPPVEGEHELLKPARDAEAALKIWTNALGNPEFGSALAALKGHVLPLPPAAVGLLYTLCGFLQVNPKWCKDVCGDANWDAIKEIALPELGAKIAAYKANAPRTGADADNSLAAVKAAAEAGNLFDASVYPAHLPIFGVLATWLQKAVTARENAAAALLEIDKVNIESV